jgi:tripartite-type tricarboxylate transporter receptor subunit TctC
LAVGSQATTLDMAVELLKPRAVIDVTIIPYRGAAQALQELMTCSVEGFSDGLMASLPPTTSSWAPTGLIISMFSA